MLSNKILYNTIIKYFMDEKKRLIDEYNNLLIKQLSDIDCRKYEIVNNFSDIISTLFNLTYEKLLKSYESNEISDIQINFVVLSNNILNSIRSCFANDDDYEKVIPIIRNLSENFIYSLTALYNVTIGHLVTNNNMKIS